MDASGVFLCAATLFLNFSKTKPAPAGLLLRDFDWGDIGFRIHVKRRNQDGGSLEMDEGKRRMNFDSGALPAGLVLVGFT